MAGREIENVLPNFTLLTVWHRRLGFCRGKITNQLWLQSAASYHALRHTIIQAGFRQS